jgi:hypothetical protein
MNLEAFILNSIILNKTDKLNIIIRGHIRGSFKNKNLYDLINELSKTYEIAIYIHTWSIHGNTTSYRKIKGNNKIVTENTIYDYFDNLKSLIKKIIIDDDSKIKLVGNLEGNIPLTKMPIIGWKRYLYGQYKIMSFVMTSVEPSEKILNIRFDILNHSDARIKSHYNLSIIVNFVKSNYNLNFKKNIFHRNETCCDNLYISTVELMYKLINHLYNNLDEIISTRLNEFFNKNKMNSHELIFLFENKYLFDKKTELNII